MSQTTRITISLPTELLDRAEAECMEPGENRSELFRRALEGLLERKRHEAAVRRYVEGYAAEPEAEYEVAAAESTITDALADDEDWG